ncbi:MAG: purine-nucleoside phosphorylase [Polyangiaceae bacterium]
MVPSPSRSSQSPPTSLSARLDDSVFAIRKRVTVEPRVGIVLGSGLGAFGDTLDDVVKISYRDVPHMPASAVEGHDGNLCFGSVAGIPVVCMQGRVHSYEGHPVDAVVQGVRTMARLGVRCALLTNAAGGLDPSWSPGDLMVIADHINLTGISPLTGPNDDALGPRFPDMTAAYDAELRSGLHACARAAGITLRDGVYAALPGPQYETPAEVRMVRALGAHAVGMSTVLEVIALRHMGLRVAGLSCITNLAAGIADHPLSHANVEATARARRSDLTALLRDWVKSAGALGAGTTP